MTKKRFQKLFRSEMTKLMQHHENAGRCIRSASDVVLQNFKNYNYTSYQQAWQKIRTIFISPNNVNPPLS